ncbi:uncharacterized protein PB18E9.04c [Etheostoma spectabile]|uniref:uncharacterized protein PB18E9.04c n=1 Tax=Etheostoma spectabile TaxID=54343 RepID=UPI0013AF2175|nr:basic leucine zipper transcriptional factor ATF-like 2 [Etheostoma spectabile]
MIRAAGGHSSPGPRVWGGEDLRYSWNGAGSKQLGSGSVKGRNRWIEREGEGQQTGNRGRKRQEKNRDAARKSRRKQTERADELHEELQCLERSNSALKKEIAALKKDLHLYTTTLERHRPFCRRKVSTSSSGSTTCLSVSPRAAGQAGPNPPAVPPQASGSTFAAAPPRSTSSTHRLGLQPCGTHLSTSTSSPPTTTTSASPRGTTNELCTTSSSVTAPYPASFSAVPAPLTSRQTNIPPVCTSVVLNPVPSTPLTAAAQPQSGQSIINESSAMSSNAGFSLLHSGALDAFLMTQDTFLTDSSNVVPSYSHLGAENTGLVAQGCSMDVPQLHPCQFSRNPMDSSSPIFQDPALQSLSAPPPDSAFALKPSYSQQVSLNPAPLLSLLTVPSPLYGPQTNSGIFDGPLSQPPSSLPQLGDISRDLSLSELLEVNDWILNGTVHQ